MVNPAKPARTSLLREDPPLAGIFGSPGIATDELSLQPPDQNTRYWRVQDWSSNALPTPRDLFVYLPEAYWHEPQHAFSVLLLHDGQNLFDGELSYVKGSTWQCGTTADREIAAGSVEPLILVGIGNTGTQRMAEYTPSPDARLGGGKGPLYAEALVEELLPVLIRDLRVQPGPEHTGIAGSSLGGLISLAIAMQYPQVFGKVGVLSPSVWWDRRCILDDVRGLPGPLPLRIWMDMGTAEGQIHVRDADLLAHLLERKGWRLDGRSTPPEPTRLRRLGSPFESMLRPKTETGPEMHYERVPGGLHNEAAWASRFGAVLRFLFPANRA